MKKFLDDIHGRYASEKKAILTLCNNGAGYSVADFSHELETSIPKVTRIVNELIQISILVVRSAAMSASSYATSKPV